MKLKEDMDSDNNTLKNNSLVKMASTRYNLFSDINFSDLDLRKNTEN